MIPFKDRLKELREGMGLSQRQLAKCLETKNASISRWENGLREPTASYVVKIAKFFDVSTDYLLGVKDFY